MTHHHRPTAAWAPRAALAFAGVALALAGCSAGAPGPAETEGAEPVSGGVIRAALAGDPQTFDMGLSTGALTIAVAQNIFEPLFALDATYTPQPMLVDQYSISDDRMAYTLTLRSDVTFHNGDTMDSGDVKASLERWMAVSSSGKGEAARIASIETPDPLTVVIELSSPSYSLLSSLAGTVQEAIIIPAEIAEAAGGNPLTTEQLIGTGPYEFGEYAPGQDVTLTRFDDYASRTDEVGGSAGAKHAYADELDYLFVTDDAQRLNGLRTGQWDWVQTIAADDADSAKQDPSLTVVESSPHLMPTITINHAASSPFHDLRARQALNMLLDKKAIATATMGPDWLWSLSPSLVPETNSAMYSDAGQDVYEDYDPDGAKKLFEEAGVTHVRIITTQTYPQYYQTMVLIQAALQDIGITAEIAVYDHPTTIAKMGSEPDSWDISMTRFSGSVTSPTQVLFLNNYPGQYDNPELTSLLGEYQQSGDADEAKSVVDQIQQLVWDDLPAIPLGDQGSLGVYSAKLHIPDEFTSNLWNAWLDPVS